MIDHQAKVQESDRRQVANGEEFNRIFAEAERAKAEVELQKIQLQRDQMEMQRAAETADRDLRERELEEKKAMRMTMARYMPTGQFPKSDDSLRSQISKSMMDDDNVLNSTHC